jgi:CHAT domain-containing protein
MEKNKTEMKKRAFLFHADVLVEGYNKAMAQESLLALLRSDRVKSVQLQSAAPPTTRPNEEELQKRKKKEASKPNDSKPSDTKQQEVKHAANDGYRHIINQIEDFKKNNTLIRLSIVKGKGVKLSIPCRILNYEYTSQYVTIYHVDEKKVYQYSLNEIDDLIVG